MYISTLIYLHTNTHMYICCKLFSPLFLRIKTALVYVAVQASVSSELKNCEILGIGIGWGIIVIGRYFLQACNYNWCIISLTVPAIV